MFCYLQSCGGLQCHFVTGCMWLQSVARSCCAAGIRSVISCSCLSSCCSGHAGSPWHAALMAVPERHEGSACLSSGASKMSWGSGWSFLWQVCQVLQRSCLTCTSGCCGIQMYHPLESCTSPVANQEARNTQLHEADNCERWLRVS